jgi:hypothetical protein
MGKTVLWVHVEVGSQSTVMWLSESSCSSTSKIVSVETMVSVLSESEDDIIVLDGVIRQSDHENFCGATFWFWNNYRRAVVVASMPFGINDDVADRLGIREFYALPEKLDKYRLAANDDTFFYHQSSRLLADKTMEKLAVMKEIHEEEKVVMVVVDET